MNQPSVAALVKDHTIHFGLRLNLDHPGGFEPIKPTLVVY
jgi:hypothetical protein